MIAQMAEAHIVSCAQCPTCKTYVPVPSDLLGKLKSSSNARAYSNGSNASLLNDTRTNTNVSTVPYASYEAPSTAQSKNRPHNAASTKLLSNYENSWRHYFLGMPVLILGTIQTVFTVLIIILEIAALGLSTYAATGAGIWCSIVFLPTAIATVLLERRWERSRGWATKVLICQIALLIFSFILIGIAGNYVSSYQITNTSIVSNDTYYQNLSKKYQVMQAQLAFAILLMFSGLAYLIFYGVVTYLALWRPFHTLDLPHIFTS